MRIQMIHPAIYVNPGALTALRPALPIGLAYITAALEKEGHECHLLDAIAEAPSQRTPDGPKLLRLGLTNEQILDRIDPEADVLAITNMWSFCWPAVRPMIRSIRERHPDKLIVCGGEHFTGLPELSMEQAPIDYIVQGEGEAIAVELFRCLQAKLEHGIDFAPGDIAGLVWRNGGEIVINSRATRIRDVDAIAWPAWDHFDIDTYNDHNYIAGIKYGKTVPILATRGCPYQCTYCSNSSMWTPRWYARDPKDVVDEMRYYQDHFGATNFPFQDLTAILKKDWIVSFCQELLARNLNITWSFPSGTRCEVVDNEVAMLLKRTGGNSLCVAPESGSERTRKLIKKRMKSESLFNAVRAAVDAKLNTSALLVIGFPHDTVADVLETVKLVYVLAKMGVEDIACAFFFPIPSTELFNYLIEQRRIELNDDFLKTPIFVHEKYLTRDRNYCENISAPVLTSLKYIIVATFYLTLIAWHPSKLWRRVTNVVENREESKMDIFLLETKRKLLRRLGRAA